MPDNDIFNQSADNSSQGTNQSHNADPFAELVGEDKRYKTPQELAKGKQEADDFIEQLKQETAQLREDLNKRLTAEEILEQIKQGSKNEDGSTKSLTEEQIAELVQGTVKNLDSQKAAESNLSKATQMVVDKYGDKAGEVIAQRATELGLSPDDLRATASRSPEAFKKLIGLEGEASNHTGSTNGTVNTQALDAAGGTGGPVHGTYQYYEKIRKEDPRRYFDPKVQNEMFQKRKELGEKFYS